jgi:hypothetical protein
VVKNSFAFKSFKIKSVYTTEEKERRALRYTEKIN